MGRPGATAGLVFAAIASVAALARAQPEPPPSASPAAPAEDAEARKAAAKAHFDKGVSLMKEKAWAAALAELRASRELYPTRSATQNLAMSLRQVQRFDEALDAYESLLRDFPNLASEDKSEAQRAVVELRGLVGTIEIDGAEVGAAVVIDGRDRGDYPLPGPMRVPSGTHAVRIYKEGFEPFEQRVDVAGGATARVTARLRALVQPGRLKVSEQRGRALDVVVDNVVVGKTPWEGPLSEGVHTVALRGDGYMGTQPASAPVKQRQVTPLTLLAEELPSSVLVQAMPAGATIAVDAVGVGRGVWEGRLRVGSHVVEIAADGFLPERRQVTLARGEREVVSATLTRDSDAAMWRKPAKVVAEASVAAVLTPGFGGDVAGGCDTGCSSPPGAGGLATIRATYELGSGFGFGAALGYLSLQQSVAGRSAAFVPTGLPTKGTADDALLLRGALVGVAGSIHRGETLPWLARLGAGVMLGAIRDQRDGRFTAAGTGATYATGTVSDSTAARFLFLDPEVRLGVRLTPHLELTGGVEALFLIALSTPRWDDTLHVDASSDGIGTYAADALAGGLVFALAGGVGARYEF